MSHPIILVFIRKTKTLKILLTKFRSLPFKKIIQITNHDDKVFFTKRYISFYKWLVPISLFILASLFIGISIYAHLWLATLLMALITIFALVSIPLEWLVKSQDPLIKQYKNLVMQGETLLLIECESKYFEKFIRIIQKIQDEPVAFFSTVDEKKIEEIRSKEMLPHPLESPTELKKQAKGLAHAHFNISYEKSLSIAFLSLVEKLSLHYQMSYEKLNNLALYNENIQLSAEWLLDNSYTVKQSINDIKKNLPENFFAELPFIIEGPYKNAPALYPLVSRIIAASDGKITLENIELFLHAYQEKKPLTMGELWAFPLILKIRLIECLVNLTEKILNRVKEKQSADFWANRILYASRIAPEKLYSTLSILSKEIPEPTTYFADQLKTQLTDTEPANAVLIGWLQRKVGENLQDIIQVEQAKQTLEQTSIANVISSMRKLEQLNWREIFERVSLVENILCEDPSSTYAKMDFPTKDLYRHRVEQLAKKQHLTEQFVAKTAISLAETQSLPFKRHVGFYLLDEGLIELQKALQHKHTILESIAGFFNRFKEKIYITCCGLLTFLSAAIFAYGTNLIHLSPSIAVSLFFLSIIPFSELAIQLINYVIAHLIPPHILPKMLYEKGIPEELRTLVVIPTLLISEESVYNQLEKLEIHYLANTDPQISFGLLSDFRDHENESSPDDLQLLHIVKTGISNLHKKYPGNHFYLFHRDRIKNQKENCWMGWERKRGKLENLNSFLSGTNDSQLDNFLHEGLQSYLSQIKYILTVDSDTQLPKNSIKRLIEALSHPLNIGHVDLETRQLLRGYTVVQPRVSTNYLSAHATWFAKMFSDPSGIDPYTKSTSDVYQDLFREGVYHGKGLYDHKLFHNILSERLPENKILSHDLLEGSYVRVAFASDIEFYDTFPETYSLYSKRQQRWVRGDWQLISWLRSKVPTTKNQRENNPLSLINRWKIFDNLRRSLLPITSMALLLISWMSGAFFPWTFLVLFVMALPIALKIIDISWITLTTKLNSIWSDLYNGVAKTIVSIAFLPHQAWINCEAIFKALYRQYYSKKLLLQWNLASTFTKKDHIFCYLELSIISLISFIILFFIMFYASYGLYLKIPILLLWCLSPLICRALNIPYLSSHISPLNQLSEQYLRLLARKSWRYFDDFVKEDIHYLPPDNYQEKLKVEIALRTSPTNIGLYMLSVISACRLGYLSSASSVKRFKETINTLKALERYEGHFLNWYDIKNICPLLPKYVSTVDSGNLLAALWTVEENCKTLLKEPILNPEQIISALYDHLHLFFKSLNKNKNKYLTQALERLSQAIKSINPSLMTFKEDIEALKNAVQNYAKSLKENIFKETFEQPHRNNSQVDTHEAIYWLNAFTFHIDHFISLFDNTMPWIELFKQPNFEKVALLHPDGLMWREIVMKKIPSYQDLIQRNLPGLIPFIGWLKTLPVAKLDEDANMWIQIFIEKTQQAFSEAEKFNDETLFLIKELQEISSEMNLVFLYNQERKLFSIGYNVSEHRIDSSCYDLLASEARLASFIGIAKGDVPLEHWWALGRPTTDAFGMIVLQSWGGTMFEYLMPVIWCKNFKNTLLDYACKVAVRCQIAYGNQLGIPWGISEAAYSRLDIHNIYQYRAFGVPFLGLKQGLENDFVVTPYSSALALMIDPTSSIKNLKRLESNPAMSGPYGFFEAIDYSREYKPNGEQGIVIHTYMAHHLGMSLSAITNTLHQGYIQELFHAHPRVKALETVLYERPDISEGKATGRVKERVFPKLSTTAGLASNSHFETADTPFPATHLLSNGNYSVMITNAGTGYSKFQDLDIGRWRIDPTCDKSGACFYIKDVERNTFFSAAHYPIPNRSPTLYQVNFSNHKAEIKKKEIGIEVTTEIVVSPEDHVEIRYMTLSNLTMRYRILEITSYIELSLAEHKADLIHPAFSKMFIETQAEEQYKGLLAHRRKRSPSEDEKWCFHISALQDEDSNTFSFETRRDIFIGNNGTLSSPEKISEPLSNSQGFVLDPAFAIRKKIRLESGKQTKISFITGAAHSKEEALRLLEKYKNIDASTRILDMAWTHAELDLRRLHITHDDSHLFQKLANFMIYPDAQLRAAAETLKVNHLGQKELWKFGISGDNSILLITIEDMYNLDVVHSALQAHAFWRLRGLKTDVIIINKEKTSYEMPLNEHLIRIAQTYAQYSGLNVSGGIYLIEVDKLSREDSNLLLASAHAILVAEKGNLGQQLAMPRRIPTTPSLLKFDAEIPEEPSPSLPFLELLFFNGIGGFTQDGKEYAIFYAHGKTNSAPWINVICNKHFGFLASAEGLGMTWNGNSQMNRLTPWSNDSTLNPITDICYIRDDETGKFWTISASPVLENDPYRARHGNGYTIYEHNSHAIDQEMTVYVPLDEGNTSARIQLIRLTNRSKRKRKLSVFNYIELTLGQDREEFQRYIGTNWNYETNSLVAVNHYRSHFSDHTVFLSSSPTAVSFTGSRKDFIGRNQTLANPTALKYTKLSQRTGFAIDPCFALQCTVEIYPHESTEIVFILGECAHPAKAKEFCNHYLSPHLAHHAFTNVKNWWDKLLSTIQIQTPDQSLNLLFNRWLIYQNLSCRFWARSAFYQSGGAFGFRDQLQDAAALVYFDPSMTKQQIIKSAERQFLEGDVQHWWHPETGSGVRTRISDDLLWLPYVAMHYIQITGDESIMELEIPYLEARILEEDEHEAIVIPIVSETKGTIKEHCLKAIEKSLHLGPHQLPLIGGGDWNDGMNLVGSEGKGESVWLAWFLIYILKEMSRWLRSKNEQELADKLFKDAEKLFEAIEENAWDGAWYLRAFFDDGTPIGSQRSEEDKIDSLSQSWAAICGYQTERVYTAMESVKLRLIDEKNKLVLLFTPPFDKVSESPGYIKGYPPGVRENGGQYTHASIWVAKAFAKLGNGDEAMQVLHMINPINHAKTLEEVNLYRVEPYVTAADIYALPGQEGRGGWTWYTGSASLMYRTILEDILGFKLRGEFLTMDPCIPKEWNSFMIKYQYHEAHYEIHIENPKHVSKGIVLIELENQRLDDFKIPLKKSSGIYHIKVVMG